MHDWIGGEPPGGPGLKWSYWWWALRADTASLVTAVRHHESPPADAMAALALARGDAVRAIRALEA